ncbi:MAG: hypothetical protein J6S67_23335 [Methanobrevibacter sp.]|nr:hypothetical protein [Methanobrevibacter sp.]
MGIANTVISAKSQAKQNKIASESLELQAEEISRQRRLEENRQRRENLELMNSVSNLTNVSWSGSQAPTMSYDKYGDLG